MTRMGLHPGMSDAHVCQLLLDKGSLTDDQLTSLVAAAARVAAGGHLTKPERDRAMAIAQAQGLLSRTMIKRKSKGPAIHNPGDCYSTVVTKGTAEAEKILARAHTPSGHMLAPPGKRRTG